MIYNPECNKCGKKMDPEEGNTVWKQGFEFCCERCAENFEFDKSYDEDYETKILPLKSKSAKDRKF